MHIRLFVTLLTLVSTNAFAQITVKDNNSKIPVSYATISFGDGYGVFADDNGYFSFSEKLYKDVDTLFISALGYSNKTIAANQLENTIFLEPEISKLNEVIISGSRPKKFKVEKEKASIHGDYFKCWLPTIESEIAVFCDNPDNRLKQLQNVIFPFLVESADWEKRNSRSAVKRQFSTMFKVKFYASKNGYPGDELTYEEPIFVVNESIKNSFTLDVSDIDLIVPKEGFFVSIQVMGYTDKTGKLLPNKKYKEIPSRNGIVKIPTNFRPLLPFTDEINGSNTFVKRTFIQNNNWVKFAKPQVKDSKLLNDGNNNYGIGINYRVFKPNK
ncbi:MAG: hypothetical protein BM564_00360 [Bacteroidetes bacterium MedPE-SWsnd-G2]|nr:MAG: hypothetical protein BM564_00360 [Bacteroidetes bacterium MedPE-SWsnd-G2]